ncbi:hypothetical protein EJ06DRAFT_23611 [Trichodelitschia bisporula]|uniref:Uncharacterized protein n=1 Tax=Trichodelitschia bisporula TaxID=703511 RepID=A0A6G1IBL1_9PEZI|nr:hypothetical protein EJ06DRAFT_23611 [Trichodelitschia bisporula]
MPAPQIDRREQQGMASRGRISVLQCLARFIHCNCALGIEGETQGFNQSAASSDVIHCHRSFSGTRLEYHRSKSNHSGSRCAHVDVRDVFGATVRNATSTSHRHGIVHCIQNMTPALQDGHTRFVLRERSCILGITYHKPGTTTTSSPHRTVNSSLHSNSTSVDTSKNGRTLGLLG